MKQSNIQGSHKSLIYGYSFYAYYTIFVRWAFSGKRTWKAVINNIFIIVIPSMNEAPVPHIYEIIKRALQYQILFIMMWKFTLLGQFLARINMLFYIWYLDRCSIFHVLWHIWCKEKIIIASDGMHRFKKPVVRKFFSFRAKLWYFFLTLRADRIPWKGAWNRSSFVSLLSVSLDEE